MAEAQKINNLQTRDSLSSIGDLVITLNAEPQAGRLFMNGETHNKYAYPLMWEHVVNNPAYGTYTTNNFTLTDMRGRVPVGQSASGTFSQLGDTMGAETHTLTTAQMPSHDHVERASFSGQGIRPLAANSSGSSGSPKYFNSTAQGGSGPTELTTETRGGGQAHNNIQPSIVVNFEVKAT